MGRYLKWCCYCNDFIAKQKLKGVVIRGMFSQCRVVEVPSSNTVENTGD